MGVHVAWVVHVYLYAAHPLWDTDTTSRLRRRPLKRRAITHFGESTFDWVPVGSRQLGSWRLVCPSSGRDVATPGVGVITFDAMLLAAAGRWPELRLTRDLRLEPDCLGTSTSFLKNLPHQEIRGNCKAYENNSGENPIFKHPGP